jgi:hypothetical protein
MARLVVWPGNMGNGCSETWVTGSLNTISHVDACDLVSSEEDAELTIGGERPDGQKLAAEGFRSAPAPIAEAKVGFLQAGSAHDRPLD